MKIAIIHDWLETFAGAETTLEQILECFPDADIFCLVDHMPLSEKNFLKNRKIKTSFIQKLPFSKRYYRLYLPLMPIAIEQFDLNGYDLVFSHSHAVAKGVITSPDQVHISYCHTPMRYIWHFQHKYLKEFNVVKGLKSIMLRYFFHKLRIWDLSSSNRVNLFIANSLNIKKRIHKTYRRNAKVLYPPVDTDFYKLENDQVLKKNFYLTASRLVPYKRVDLIMKAFQKMPRKNLIVIGDGSEMRNLKKIKSENIKLVGHSNREVLKKMMVNAKAFIFAAEEDFGIVPLEAQACGTPVIAYGKGGSLETIIEPNKSENPTGLFFHEQSEESLIKCIEEFESKYSLFRSENCRKNAERFSKTNFKQNLNHIINQFIEEKKYDEEGQ